MVPSLQLEQINRPAEVHRHTQEASPMHRSVCSRKPYVLLSVHTFECLERVISFMEVSGGNCHGTNLRKVLGGMLEAGIL